MWAAKNQGFSHHVSIVRDVGHPGGRMFKNELLSADKHEMGRSYSLNVDISIDQVYILKNQYLLLMLFQIFQTSKQI